MQGLVLLLVFFGTAMLDYRLYKDVFPLWE